MNVLVDTSVWSQALRRKGGGDGKTREILAGLIDAYRVRIIGPIRQEILSGIPDKTQFEALRIRLLAFEDLPIGTEDYERAASHYNDCRAQGIQGSHIDFLICAVAELRGLAIYTLDHDFTMYRRVLGISLFIP